MKPILAIDPGASGGLAWWRGSSGYDASPMPDTEGELINQLRELSCAGHEVAMVEDVGGYVGGGGQPGSAMFRFGFNCGVLRGALMALGYRVELVRPQKWQKHFGLGSKAQAGGTGPWKRKLKAEAERRFPTCDVTLKTADALLILDYAMAQAK